MNRRDFLSTLTLGAAGLLIPVDELEPRRKMWFVPRSAPVLARSSPMSFFDFVRNDDLLLPDEQVVVHDFSWIADLQGPIDMRQAPFKRRRSPGPALGDIRYDAQRKTVRVYLENGWNDLDLDRNLREVST